MGFGDPSMTIVGGAFLFLSHVLWFVCHCVNVPEAKQAPFKWMFASITVTIGGDAQHFLSPRIFDI